MMVFNTQPPIGVRTGLDFQYLSSSSSKCIPSPTPKI